MPFVRTLVLSLPEFQIGSSVSFHLNDALNVFTQPFRHIQDVLPGQFFKESKVGLKSLNNC